MPGSVGSYTQGWFPWVAVKSTVGTWSRNNLSDNLGMGYWTNDTAAQNDEFTIDTYMDSVTWKLAVIGYTNTNRAIADYQLNGVSIGTLDWYAALTNNVYKEVTGITVASPGVKTFKVIGSSKNASSSGYVVECKSIALIRTGGTASTPAGTDTPGYTWEWIPWMGSKANTSWDTRRQTSAEFSGGTLGSSVQNAAVSTDWHADTGTHKVSCIHFEHPNYGIITFKRGSTTLGTIDSYNAASTANSYDEITGITIATAGTDTFEMSVPTKNASAGGYAQDVNSVKWTRTGA